MTPPDPAPVAPPHRYLSPQKEAALLREAVEVAHVGTWEWDIRANRITWSDELFRLYGLKPQEFEATYEAFLRYLHPEDRPMVDETVKGAFGTHAPFSFDHRLVRPDGEVRWLHGRGKVEVDASGNPVRMFGTANDITERKRAEEERTDHVRRLQEIEYLKQLNDMRTKMMAELVEEGTRRKEAQTKLEAANRTMEELVHWKTQLLNMVSHEIGTPLTPIKIQFHLLRSPNAGPLTEEQRRSLGVVERNLARLESLIQDVLDVSRLEARRLTLEPVPTDLVHLVREVVESFGEQARRAGVELAIQGKGPVRAVADPKRVTQVLFNLVSNALKFTPKGGAVRIEAARAGAEAVVTVRDTGIGFRRDAIPKLFQPFSRIEQPSVKAPPGTGLGLYICKGIVEQHGGRISCESAGPGMGAAFSFALPVAGPAPLATARPAQGVAALGPT